MDQVHFVINIVGCVSSTMAIAVRVVAVAAAAVAASMVVVRWPYLVAQLNCFRISRPKQFELAVVQKFQAQFDLITELNNNTFST